MFSTKIPSKGIIIKYQKYDIKKEHDEYDEQEDIKDKKSILYFKNKQILFVIDDYITIWGGRFVVMINDKGKTFVEDLYLPPKPKNSGPYIHYKYISEVEEIRLLTSNEIILIRKKLEEIKSVFNIFDEHITK